MKTILFAAASLFVLSTFSGAEDINSPQDPSIPPNKTRTQMPTPTVPPVRPVGIRQSNEVHGQPSSAGSLDESNGSNMGAGVQFDLGKPKSNEPTQDKDKQDKDKDDEDND